MRKKKPVDALFPATRQAIFAATFMHPDRWWYLSDLAKHLGVPPSSLQREFAALVAAGILRRRRDGNRVYFQPDPACPFFAELQGLTRKTVGLVDVLRAALDPFASQIQAAFVYGSLARSEEVSESDVDLMVIGDVALAALAPALRAAETKLNRPVNPTVYTASEVAKKLRAGHHFLHGVFAAEKLFVLGRTDQLERAARRPAGPAARH